MAEPSAAASVAPKAPEGDSAPQQQQAHHSVSAPQTRNGRIINSLLVGLLWISTLSIAGCFLSSKQRKLSLVMQRIADFIHEYVSGAGDFNDIRIGSFRPSEDQIIGTWLALFWASIVSLVVRKQYSIVYMATPVMLSLFLQYLGKFTTEEYLVVVIPFLLSVWELASD